ncbi:hypothetical protein [Arthrobacter sp. B10-11]|uniref:hypothetical protein n=1 Tax=Arthrobacter sp. B10-11 TaxID=3081160 RepID=UPI0029533F01|nr:hypothetical protein [Arthrobacter sp. B10-11]MDV8149837.1 hypothetical protein [Arthrobacter sp. B10-11]
MPHPPETAERRAAAVAQGRPSRPWNRKVVGICLGLVVMAGFLLLVQLQPLSGWWVLALTGVLALAVPTARQLSQRIVILGCLYFGAVPLLWWMPLPAEFPGWGQLLLGGLISGLAMWIIGSPDRKAAAASLLPSAGKADTLLLVAAALASAVLVPYFRVSTGPQALGLLLASWDNSSHFSMYNMIRTHGTVVPMAGISESGHPWTFMEYPQGFHTALATMADLAVGHAPGLLGTELVTYSRLSSLAAVGATVMVTAALTSLPWIRERPMMCTPFVVLAITAWSFGTASIATLHAFQNFVVGVALLVCLMIVVSFADSLAKPVVFTTCAAAVVGIANTWALLLLLVVPVAAFAVFPWSRQRWQGTRAEWLANSVTAAAGLLGLALVGLQISRIETGTVVTAIGRVPSSTHGVEIATFLVALAASILLVHGNLREFLAGQGQLPAAARLVVTPVLGLAVVIALGTYQIVTAGKVNYYSLKLALAVELILPVIACVAVTALVGRWLASQRYGRPRGLAVMSALAALASTQVFGLTVQDTRPLGMDPMTPYQQGMSTIESHTSKNADAATQLFRAAETHTAGRGDAMYIINSEQIDPLLAATWYLALTGTHNQNTNGLVEELRPLHEGYGGNLAHVAEDVLEADPDVSLVLDAALRDFLASEGLSEQLLKRTISVN